MSTPDAQPPLLYKGHPGRADSCARLAESLWNRFKQTGDVLLLDKAIELDREALCLQPVGHPDRARSCENLALGLRTRFDQTGDTVLLDEALDLAREALRLRPEGHPRRAHSCGNLAVALRTRYNQTGEMGLLNEALDLERKAIRPEGHPDRAMSCGNLAVALQTLFDQTGDMRLLDEALDLAREVLRLRPEGHPDRAHSCGNLAVALRSRFDHTGDMALLDEALDLAREALRLRPEGHPDRVISCGNLARALRTRFDQTGDIGLLDEALDLQREILRLRPEGHLDRAHSCGNLAVALRTRFNQTGEIGLLDEALDLQREALRLRPEGHPDRVISCGNLARALRSRFDQTGQMGLLDEALDLEREALRLCPEGYPRHASLCAELIISLRIRFKQSKDSLLLDEARSLCTRAIIHSAASPYNHVRLRVEQAHIHSLPTYSSCSPSAAVEVLLEAMQFRTAIIPHFYPISYVLRSCAKVVASNDDHVRLLSIYQVVIDVLPEMGSVVLPKLVRLRRWQKAGNLPLEALLQAVKASNLHTGLELLEQGRAVLWSETLAIEGSYLQDLPEEWKTRMQMLMQSTSAAVEHGDTQHSGLAARDRAHANYTLLQQLLKDIRASPGLERFMRGPSYSELVQVASAHPVIILAASDTACHALVLSSASVSPTHLVLNRISSTDIEFLGHDIRGMDLNVRALSGLVVATEVRGAFVNGKREDPALRKLHKALERLWADVVKPILDCLGFKVCGMTLNI
jgi:tetratricopeptide (TPR) repeat protein